MPNPAIFLCMVEIISLPGVWENWTQHPGKILPDWEPEQSLLLGPSTFSLPPANIIHSAFTWAPTTKVGKRFEDPTLRPIRSALGGLCWQTWALSSTQGSSQHPLLLQFHLHLFYRLKGGAQRHPSRVQQLLKQPLLPDSDLPRAFLLAGCPELTRLNLMSHHHCQIPRTMATADIFNQNKPQGQREASCKRNKSKGNIWHFTFDREGLINFYCGGIKSETKDPLSLHSQDAEGLSHPCTENSCSKSLHLIMIDSLLKNKSVQPGMHANTFPPVFPRPTF